MQLQYIQFYKQYGIRRLQQLLSPRLCTLTSFPRNSFYHYLSDNNEVLDLDVSKLFYSGYTKRILVDYPSELTSELGAPKRKAVILKSLFRPFHISNKKYKYLADHYRIIKDELTLVVNNYSYLHAAYRYIELPLTVYHKWFNIHKTMFDSINVISKDTNRQHFISVDLPEFLPSFSLLNIYINKVNTTMLKIFNTPSMLFFLEVWKWLSVEYRDKSIFAGLEKESFSKINLLINGNDGRVAILNLGYLNSWIKEQENTTEMSTVTQLNPTQIQKLFLKMAMSVQEMSTVDVIDNNIEDNTESTSADPEDISEDKAIKDEEEDYYSEHEGGEEEPDPLDLAPLEANLKQSKGENNLLNKLNNNKDLTSLSSNLSLDSQFFNIDEEIDTLDSINRHKLAERGVHIDKDGEEIELTSDEEQDNSTTEEIQASIFKDKDYITILTESLNLKAEEGLITASEYKKALKSLEHYSNMKDPYGSEQLAKDKAVVTKDDIALDTNKIVMSDSKTVIDKDMLASTLSSFDRDYIEKVLQKDILAAVGAIQKAGVIIKNHEIENEHSALGSYEHHTLELAPIDGMPSTIHFRIPKVNPGGTYECSGNTYSMRKQRNELPIRKINPYTVALTSYYGKTFVNISQKKVNNSLSWIVSRIEDAAMSDEVYHISKVAPANVFDNTFDAPYMYGALANNFKSFKAGSYNFLLDHTARTELVAPELLEKLEKNGSRLIGYSDKKEPLIIDKHDIFHIYTKNTFTEVGDIFTILQLDTEKAPLDFSEVRVFSKTIPVGIIFGYFIGFTKLLKLLKVKYRTVIGRQRKEMSPYEYCIGFQDKSYIFSRKDKFASLFLAGYLDYEKQLRQYTSAEFNKPDVYYNLIESKGLGAIYVRELGLCNNLFVDPITKSILEEMNEPTTYLGLLQRSTELLLTYTHPDAADMRYMRIRGYERIAGAIYKELALAIRQFKNKNISGRSKIDMSPYQIWSLILKDPANKITEDINPIQNLKETEIVTYAGEGGRSKDAMLSEARAYHQTDMGVISEATVDSGDVGVNIYLSANPNFRDMRGIVNVDKKLNPTTLLSTSCMLSPGSANDSPKRVNIQ